MGPSDSGIPFSFFRDNIQEFIVSLVLMYLIASLNIVVLHEISI